MFVINRNNFDLTAKLLKKNVGHRISSNNFILLSKMNMVHTTEVFHDLPTSTD